MAFQSATSQIYPSGIAQNLNPGLPAGATSSSILLFSICGLMTSGATITAPTGWTLIQRQDFQQVGNAVYWALGNVASLDFTIDYDFVKLVTCLAFTGRNTSTPVTASAKTSYAGWPTLDAPSVTAAANDDICAFWHGFQAAAFGTVPASYTDRVSLVYSPSDGQALNVATRDGVSAGATGVLPRTCSDYVDKTAITVSLAAVGAALSVIQTNVCAML